MSAVWRWSVWLLVVLATLGVVLGFGGRWNAVLDAIGYFRPHLGILAALGGVLAIGMPRRRIKWIGFAAAALAVATLGPVWRAVERPAPTSGKTQEITVMTANIFGGKNQRLDLTASALLAADADVLAVLEAPRALAAPDSLLMRHYPHSTVQPDARNGVIIWSKFPLQNVETSHARRRQPIPAPAFATARVDLGGGAGVGVTAVHLSWPLVANGAQEKQIALLGSLLAAEAGPKVLMGDFNAPPWSQAMKRVEANTGLSMIGGARQTWKGGYPNPVQYLFNGALYGREIPALLGQQIDHVLLSNDVGVKQVEVFPLPGSDHSAVWTRLIVPLRVPGIQFAGR